MSNSCSLLVDSWASVFLNPSRMSANSFVFFFASLSAFLTSLLYVASRFVRESFSALTFSKASLYAFWRKSRSRLRISCSSMSKACRSFSRFCLFVGILSDSTLSEVRCCLRGLSFSVSFLDNLEFSSSEDSVTAKISLPSSVYRSSKAFFSCLRSSGLLCVNSMLSRSTLTP